ncbi:MAG: hypothetical protein COX62_04620 [Deltaproteobacteria bacterium CG_4_10_14_0_2_um_filter_43_8]|nr:MAG: hypothetical protein COV43_04515 [Deltaproteobacteria bacterium CG11_big_fil_rev_8_21_14_0_20_42_23]PJA20529.1 MAG: hypothetical protein COX62_04620 [Deltaproteobacteria bacterium CG_4_10_14_0_2_um_filter_43_8]PJC65038.1 MAG: hypothetical protein CO021_00905 [Deltaproteobacteria bacterium CG_4_9_14_0_2_um_filter_42_21]
MAFNVQALDALERAIEQGVSKVQYEDKTVTYRSLEEMMRLRSVMRQELGLASPHLSVLSSHSKGFDQPPDE